MTVRRACGVEGCGWSVVTDDDQEAILARVRHLRDEHFADPEHVFEDDNLLLIETVHDALHAIDMDELDGWYSSQVERMRDDACEIMGVHDNDHPRTATALDHSADASHL